MEEDALDLYDTREDGLPWYVMNCVVGNEVGLQQQAQDACRALSPWDVQGFVVPLREAEVLSHGAKQLKVQRRVKYPGAVFCKMRLCLETFETLTKLGLCRSWMSGTTFRKRGHSRNAIVPAILGPHEVEKFQLEQAFAEEYPDAPDEVEEEMERQRRRLILRRRQGEVEEGDGDWAGEPNLKDSEGVHPSARKRTKRKKRDAPPPTDGASVTPVAPLTAVAPRAVTLSSVQDDGDEGSDVVVGRVDETYSVDDDEGVVTILDDESVDEADAEEAERKRFVDDAVARDYGGFSVGTMVQVVAEGNFQGEEGVVRRLKEGQLFITFRTFGSKFEAWLAPTDVRALTEVEVWKGGAEDSAQPQSPIRQADLEAMYGLQDGDDSGDGGRERRSKQDFGDKNRGPDNNSNNEAQLRQDLYQRATGRVQRNRREDRVSRGEQSNSAAVTRQERDAQWKAYQNVQRFETQQRLLKERQEAKRKATYNDEIWGLVERSSWTGGEDGSSAFGVSDYSAGNPQMLWSVASRRSLQKQQREEERQRRQEREEDWRRSGGRGAQDLSPAFRSGPVKMHTQSARQRRREGQEQQKLSEAWSGRDNNRRRSNVERALEGDSDWTTFAGDGKRGGGWRDSFSQGPLEMMTPQQRQWQSKEGRGESPSRRQVRRQRREEVVYRDAGTSAATPTPTASYQDDGDNTGSKEEENLHFFDKLVSELTEDLSRPLGQEDDTAEEEKNKKQENALFSSLVTELTSAAAAASETGGGDRQQGQGRRQDGDDFFRDMEAELSASVEGGEGPVGGAPPPPSEDEDDFFAKLEQELSSPSSSSSKSLSAQDQDSLIERLDAFQDELDDPAQREDDDNGDFFANLQSEVSVALDGDDKTDKSQAKKSSRNDDTTQDFFASLEAELSDISSSVAEGEGELEEKDIDFFASLENPEAEEDVVVSAGSAAEEEKDFFAQLESQLDESLKIAPSSDVLSPSSTTDETLAEEKETIEEATVATRVDLDTDKKKKKTTKKKKDEEEAPSEEASSLEDLTKLTVPVLKDLLRQRGLKVSGKKAELIERLQQQEA